MRWIESILFYFSRGQYGRRDQAESDDEGLVDEVRGSHGRGMSSRVSISRSWVGTDRRGVGGASGRSGSIVRGGVITGQGGVDTVGSDRNAGGSTRPNTPSLSSYEITSWTRFGVAGSTGGDKV